MTGDVTWSGARRLLLFSTGQRGPGTMCGGITIASAALRRLPHLCVMAMTDCDGVGRLRPDERFDHIRLPFPAPRGGQAQALRSVVIDSAISNFRPDVVVVLRSTGSDRELLDPLVGARSRRPALRTALVLWDLLGAHEVEALSTMPDPVHDVFDEIWSIGDPVVDDHRRHLGPAAASRLRDVGYLVDHAGRSLTLVDPTRRVAPRIALDLGSGWLADGALDVLGAALTRPGLRGVVAELRPNALLGRARADQLAARLGIAVERTQPPGPSPSLLVSTGGYNSVCSALRVDTPAVVVHDGSPSTATRRGDVLAALDAVTSIDLSAASPTDVAHGLLAAMAAGPEPRGLATGGAAAVADRVVDMLDPVLVDELAAVSS